MTVAVRELGEQDIEAVVRLLGMLFEQEADFHSEPARQRRALRELLAEPRIGSVLVAVRGERVVGVVILLSGYSTALGEHVCWLEDYIVDPAERGAGIGGLLLDAALAEARRRGWTRVTLLTDHDNVLAQRLYERHGYERSQMVVMRRSA